MPLALSAAVLLGVVASVPTVEARKGPTTKEEFAAIAKRHPLPPWLPFSDPGHKRVVTEYVCGEVVDVGDDYIEVRPTGKKKAVRLPTHVLLATGGVCHWEGDNACYLLPGGRFASRSPT